MWGVLKTINMETFINIILKILSGFVATACVATLYFFGRDHKMFDGLMVMIYLQILNIIINKIKE